MFSTIQKLLLKTGRRLGRPDLLFWTLPYLMGLIVIGTITQKTLGLYEAQSTYFSAFYFSWQGIPLPAGYTILAILAVNLSCKFLFLSTWKRSKIGTHIIHLSIIILLFGGLLTALTMKEGFIPLKEGQTRDQIMAYVDGGQVIKSDEDKQLPFSITLNRFQRDVYPGTNMPREYESRITIRDGDLTWPAVISMNNPLRYQGYTFYQSSTTIDKDGKPVSILSVVTNDGWLFPYISGILLALGLIYQLVWRVKYR